MQEKSDLWLHKRDHIVSSFARRHAHNYLMMGRKRAEGGALADARRLLHHSLDLDPEYIPALRMVAALEYTLGDLPMAKQFLGRLLLLVSPDAELLFLAGNIALSDSNPREAVEYFHQAEARGGHSEELYFNMGMAHLILEEGLPAEHAFLTLLKDHPHHAHAWDALGCARRQTKNYDGAVQAFQQSLLDEYGNNEARDHLAQTYLELGKAQLARQILEEALSLEPQRRGSRHLLGMAFAAADNYPDAVACWETVIAQGDAPPEAYHLLANAYLHLNDFALAMHTLETLVSLFPNHLPGHLQLALLFLEHGDRSSAGEHLRIARALDPNNPMLAHVLAAVKPISRELRPTRDA